MKRIIISLTAAASVVVALPWGPSSTGLAAYGVAQAQTAPGATTSAVVQAGTYRVDGNHTQVVWSVDHMGFSRLYGMVGGMSGTLQGWPQDP
jgi:polyisoprenoid-binding protein YceI